VKIDSLRHIRKSCFVVAAVALPSIAAAQGFPTEFPAGSVPLEGEALRKRIEGQTYWVKPADGNEFRVQYLASKEVFLNIYFPGRTLSDTGTWRIEGSSVCVEWRQVKSGCTAHHLVGDQLYVKRASNGEVVVATTR